MRRAIDVPIEDIKDNRHVMWTLLAASNWLLPERDSTKIILTIHFQETVEL